MNRAATLYFPLFLTFWVTAAAAGQKNKFDTIKSELASAREVKLKVAVAVTSKIFKDVDSSNGEIAIADDGRYFAQMGRDIYLFDGKCTWEISLEYRQATKRCLKDGEKFENRLVFIKNLDEYYEPHPIRKDLIYLLTRKDSDDSPMPDSLTIFLDKSADRIARLEYFDLNGDLNRVYILSERPNPAITDSLYHFNRPDSMEVITLP
ncbi:exported hypothetical protein [Candidatus Zixiibacteriota bacterium]|nr:exported hypothetical protein [candidate division Zixibacteria bacterium]